MTSVQGGIQACRCIRRGAPSQACAKCRQPLWVRTQKNVPRELSYLTSLWVWLCTRIKLDPDQTDKTSKKQTDSFLWSCCSLCWCRCSPYGLSMLQQGCGRTPLFCLRECDHMHTANKVLEHTSSSVCECRSTQMYTQSMHSKHHKGTLKLQFEAEIREWPTLFPNT